MPHVAICAYQLIIEEQQQRLNNLDNHFYYKREAFEVASLFPFPR